MKVEIVTPKVDRDIKITIKESELLIIKNVLGKQKPDKSTKAIETLYNAISNLGI